MASYGGTFAIRDTTVSGTAYPLQIEAATPSNTLYLDSSGKVGIGTSSPAYQLDTGTLGHNSTGELLLTGGNNASNDYTQTTLLRLRATSINPSRTIHDDAASVAEIRFNHANNAGNDSSGSISFYTNPNNYNTAAQERMRIDASGNVLVGTTSTSASVAGGRIFSTGRLVTSVNNEGHYFRRNSSDGTIVEFAKDGTTVGSIGAEGGRLYIGSDDTSIFFDSGAYSINKTSWSCCP
jgi:hypothetical protein